MRLAELKAFVRSLVPIHDDAFITRWINVAAREIWDNTELFLEETRIKPDSESSIISLPYFIYIIMGIRPCDYATIELQSVSAAYAKELYLCSPFTWRFLKHSPLTNSISEEGTLKFEVSIAEDEDIEFYIEGSNSESEKLVETVTLVKGNTSVFSSFSYNDLRTLEKSKKTKSNVIVTDASDSEVAFIPNHILEARNTLIQVVKDNCKPYITNCVTVLYKPYPPILIEDNDSFPEPYGTAVGYKAAALSLVPSKENLEHASVLNNMADKIVQQTSTYHTTAQVKPVRTSRGFWVAHNGL